MYSTLVFSTKKHNGPGRSLNHSVDIRNEELNSSSENILIYDIIGFVRIIRTEIRTSNAIKCYTQIK